MSLGGTTRSQDRCIDFSSHKKAVRVCKNDDDLIVELRRLRRLFQKNGNPLKTLEGRLRRSEPDGASMSQSGRFSVGQEDLLQEKKQFG